MITFIELQKQLGVSVADLNKARRDKLSPGECFHNDIGELVFNDAGEEKLRLFFAVPLAVPTLRRAKVVRAAPNPRWVYAEFVDARRKGVVPVAIPRRLYGRLLGKEIPVAIIEDANGGKTYRHGDLSNT
jgi:hypothetical protein